jgi:high-affinity nickel-transport protein
VSIMPAGTATELSREFVNLAMIILFMGMKHGLDADHLAAIDGLTRFNAVARPRLARAAGILFACGHGLVVVTVAVGVSMFARVWRVPEWLEAFGAWTSIVVLTLLALTNIVSVLRTPRSEVARLRGWRSGMLASMLSAGSPVMVIGTGTLFALSFDTLSQATLFAATATRFGGWRPALVLAAIFTCGMMLIDGANGAWVARMMGRLDRKARAASRAVAFTVAGAGLLTAAMTLATRTSPGVEAWLRGKELWVGAAVITIVGTSLAMGRRLASVKA